MYRPLLWNIRAKEDPWKWVCSCFYHLCLYRYTVITLNCVRGSSNMAPLALVESIPESIPTPPE